MSNPYTPEHVRELGDLASRTYYVVRVSFEKGNSRHRAIMWHHHDGFATLFCSGYEHPHRIRFQTFYDIEVLERIHALDYALKYK